MAAATAVGSISAYVKEELSYVRKECEPEVDGVFSEMYSTSMGVSRSIGRSNDASGAGATWDVIVSFSTGVAGAFRNVAATGPSTTDQTLTGQLSRSVQGKASPHLGVLGPDLLGHAPGCVFGERVWVGSNNRPDGAGRAPYW